MDTTKIKTKYKILKDINSNEVFELPLIQGKKEVVGDVVKVYNHQPFYNVVKKCWDCKTTIKECVIIEISTKPKNFDFVDVSGQ